VVARGQPPRIAQQRPTSHIPTTTILFTCQRAYPSPAGPETRLGSLPRVARLSTRKKPNSGRGRSRAAPRDPSPAAHSRPAQGWTWPPPERREEASPVSLTHPCRCRPPRRTPRRAVAGNSR
jgi:hypothetical protein